MNIYVLWIITTIIYKYMYNNKYLNCILDQTLRYCVLSHLYDCCFTWMFPSKNILHQFSACFWYGWDLLLPGQWKETILITLQVYEESKFLFITLVRTEYSSERKILSLPRRTHPVLLQQLPSGWNSGKVMAKLPLTSAQPEFSPCIQTWSSKVHGMTWAYETWVTVMCF